MLNSFEKSLYKNYWILTVGKKLISPRCNVFILNRILPGEKKMICSFSVVVKFLRITHLWKFINNAQCKLCSNILDCTLNLLGILKTFQMNTARNFDPPPNLLFFYSKEWCRGNSPPSVIWQQFKYTSQVFCNINEWLSIFFLL